MFQWHWILTSVFQNWFPNVFFLYFANELFFVVEKYTHEKPSIHPWPHMQTFSSPFEPAQTIFTTIISAHLLFEFMAYSMFQSIDKIAHIPIIVRPFPIINK